MAQGIREVRMMRQTLNNSGEQPPGGYRFFNKETEIWTTGPSLGELIVNVTKHRRASELPPVSAEEVESQLCAMMPPGICSHHSPEHRARARLIGRPRFDQVNEFTVALARRWFGANGLVSQAEADTHGKTCAGCFYNQTPEGCTACNSNLTNAAIELAIGTKGKTTKYDPKLKSCLICKCHLKAKVWSHPEDVRAASPEIAEVLPDWCWVKHDLALKQ